MIGSGFLGFEFYWKVRFLEGFDSDPVFLEVQICIIFLLEGLAGESGFL